ncbi:response regulator [Rhizobium sp. S152]|uniref:response regulator n=1 Tax=Rhizobium sp. S152 TaxID=3055038 RepID=UPI0025A965C3|nr:response regulator [Rhizobium sp. S152]MDM9627669.1 response regulator [Rhizobium sp. S152]
MSEIEGTVLLLEDEPFIALDLEEMLGELGAPNVVTLATCQAALDWLYHNNPVFAVIDPRLKDGYCSPVARHLSAKGVPFIVHSGDPEGAGLEDDAFDNGVWLPKPSPPNDLQAAISRIVQTF